LCPAGTAEAILLGFLGTLGVEAVSEAETVTASGDAFAAVGKIFGGKKFGLYGYLVEIGTSLFCGEAEVFGELEDGLIECGVDHGFGSGREASGKGNGDASHDVGYNMMIHEMLFQFYVDPLNVWGLIKFACSVLVHFVDIILFKLFVHIFMDGTVNVSTLTSSNVSELGQGFAFIMV
jgi:hypothetical protein